MTLMAQCALCSRLVEDALTVQVDFGWPEGPATVCDFCMSRADEPEDEEMEGAA